MRTHDCMNSRVPASSACFAASCERCAHLFDLADARAHLDGEIDRQVPDVVGGEVLEHSERIAQAEAISEQDTGVRRPRPTFASIARIGKCDRRTWPLMAKQTGSADNVGVYPRRFRLMHFQKLDLNLLVALDALIEERSVSRAADRLHSESVGHEQRPEPTAGVLRR